MRAECAIIRYMRRKGSDDLSAVKEQTGGKRPNRYKMTLLARKNWPEWTQKIMAFSEALRQNGKRYAAYDATKLLQAWQPDESEKIGMVSWNLEKGNNQQMMYLFEASDGKVCETALSEIAEHIVCMTQEGLPILQCFGEDGHGIKSLICLDEEGGERWSFRPALSSGQMISVFPTAPEDEILLLVSNVQDGSAQVCRLSKEDGQIHIKKEFGAADFVTHVVWMEEMKCFALYSLGRNELWICDEYMEMVRCIRLGEKLLRLDYTTQYTGHLAIKSGLEQELNIVNLLSEEIRKIHLENPAHFLKYMEDGTIIAQSASGKTVIFFDENGKVISRHRFKNPIQRISQENGRAYIVTCFGYEDAIVRDVNEVMDSVQVWRVEENRS